LSPMSQPGGPGDRATRSPARCVVAVVPDLFYATRIATTAAALGVELILCAEGDALEACRDRSPDLVILDLRATGDPFALARALKRDPATGRVPIVGFYSHVDQESRRAAEAAGVDRALPRSAFTQRLPELLAGEPRAERS